MSVETIARCRHRLLELAQHLARMHVARVLRRPRATTASRSCVQPSSSVSHAAFSAVDRRRARASRLAWQASGLPARRASSAAAAACASPQMPTEIGFTRPEHRAVGVDLDDLRVLRPVVEAVLRQRAERPEPRAERQHHVGLRDQLHRRLRALVAERAAPQRMARRERSRCAGSCCTPAPAAARRARSPRRRRRP